MKTKPSVRRCRAAASLALALLVTAALSFGAPQAQPGPAPSAPNPTFESRVDALFAAWNSLNTPGAAARIQFVRDRRGAITGLLVSTGRVLNLKFARTGR